MSSYRHWYIPGGHYFFTVVTYHRWQPRFWGHFIRDEEDLQRRLDYIHYNPVKHGYVNSPTHWPRSSFRKYLKRSFYESSWGIQEPQSIADLDIE